jgi:hypothetical protein
VFSDEAQHEPHSPSIMGGNIRRLVMTIPNSYLAALTLTLTIVAAATAGNAQPLRNGVGAARAAAIQACSARAAPYREYLWGNMEFDQYRACMAEYGQPE